MIIEILWFIDFIFATTKSHQTLKEYFENVKGENVKLIPPTHPQTNSKILYMPYKTLLYNMEMISGNDINDIIKIDDHMGSKIIVNLVDECINPMILLSEFSEFIIQSSNKNLSNLKQNLIVKLRENIFYLEENEIKTLVNNIEQMDKSSWLLIPEKEKLTLNIEVIRNDLTKLLQMINIYLDFNKLPIVKNSNNILQKIMFFLKFENKNTKVMYKTDLYIMYIKNGKYEIINMNEEFIYKINNEIEKIMKLIEEEIAIEKIINEIEKRKEKIIKEIEDEREKIIKGKEKIIKEMVQKIEEEIEIEKIIKKIEEEKEKIIKEVEEEIEIEKIIKKIEEEKEKIIKEIVKKIEKIKEKKRKIVDKSFLIIPILGSIVLLIAISVFIIYVYKNKSTKSLSIYTIENIS